MARYNGKYHKRKDLEDNHPGNLHEQGVPWVVSVREDGGETKEENWSRPCCDDHNQDGLFCHERNVPEWPCDGEEAVNSHGEDAGVRTVEESEAYFEEDTCMSKINREEAKLDEKDRWKEGQAGTEISHGQRQDKPVLGGVKARFGDNQINNETISNHCQDHEEPS